jgi:monothiol glutaredoxin
MPLEPALQQRIKQLVGENRVVLFMKGTRSSPRCGFSAATVGALDAVCPDYLDVDVLQDPEVREGIKVYGNWPTIPQLYVNGEFVGGCDIVREMYQSGELQQLLVTQPA